MDIKEIRRSNMLRLVDQLGSINALAEKTDTPASYVSNVKNKVVTRGKPRALGYVVARRFEERLGLPEGWMDKDHVDGTPPSIRNPKLLYIQAEQLANLRMEALKLAAIVRLEAGGGSARYTADDVIADAKKYVAMVLEGE